MQTFVVRVTAPANEFYIVCAQNERDALATMNIRLGVPPKRVDAVKAQPPELCEFLGLEEGQVFHVVAAT